VTTNPLVRKLGIKPGMRALVVGAPPVYLKMLAPLPEGVVVTSTANGTYPFVQLFATSLADIGKSVPYLLKHAARGALLWSAYPKKTSGIESDLSRDLISKAMSGTGWRPVSIIAIDEVWSALRFRPMGDVKTKRKA
jgi:hypothetical protein